MVVSDHLMIVSDHLQGGDTVLPIAAAGGLGPVEPVQGLDRGVHVRGARMPVAGIGSHLQVSWVMVKPNENQGEYY